MRQQKFEEKPYQAHRPLDIAGPPYNWRPNFQEARTGLPWMMECHQVDDHANTLVQYAHVWTYDKT
eukprot:12421952-Karenia_brevis.AAC.1